MNRHELADVASLRLAAIDAGRARFFESSVDSRPFEEHLDAVHLDALPGPSLGPHEVPAGSLVGRVDSAYLVYRWNDIQATPECIISPSIQSGNHCMGIC